MKKILFSIIALLGVFASQSCSDMLETGNDSMVVGPELNSKTDSVFYALGIAQAMQQLADQYYFIGEMRGDLVETTTYTDNNLRQLSDYSATTTNAYDSAYVYYKVINNCNYYLAHRDTTLYTGATNVTINEYAAVTAFRAWAYLQLARTYGGSNAKIPFFTKPLTAISDINEDNFPKYNLSQIVAELAPELKKYSGLAVPNFGTTNYGIGNTNWGGTKAINPEKIFVPVDVVLGEMYLENGQYLEAAQHYCRYLCDNKLVPRLYGGIHSESRFMSEDFPLDFGSYNAMQQTYVDFFYNTPSPDDAISYIPMAVSSQRGVTSNIPLAFGYDYYSTDRSANCPRVETIQIAPSKSYLDAADNADYYYYPTSYNGTQLKTNPDTVYAAKMGDGRASIGVDQRHSNPYILNRGDKDTTLIYISKAMNANVMLYRTTTVYLHLAEALNGMGYPDAAFAILRNGISTYLEEIQAVADPEDETGFIPDYKYMSPEAVKMLSTEVPFLSAENREIFKPENVYGIHCHGGGTINYASNKVGQGLENGVTVVGSRATAVGSQVNGLYLPGNIIGNKLFELQYKFNLNVDFSNAKEWEAAMLDVLCDEYAMEFAFEGTRFYDLQRIARHFNESGVWGGNFGSRWMADKLKNKGITKDLNDPNNWYLPFK